MNAKLCTICYLSSALSEIALQLTTPPGPWGVPARKLAKDAADTLPKAWSDMAIRNVLSDMLRNVRSIVSGVGKLALNTKNLDTCKEICTDLIRRMDQELKQHSPSLARYSEVLCLGYKIKVAGDRYTGKTDDAEDMKTRCDWMKDAIQTAYALADRNGKNYNMRINMLKVFVAPEFFFRGRNGAYDHAIVHGGEEQKDLQGKIVKTQHKGLAESLLEEIGKPEYKDWLFVLGTAIAATKLSVTACLHPGCKGKIDFKVDKTTGKTEQRCNINPKHYVGEKVEGAQIENVGLIFKEGEFHTVSKELVSHIDFVADKSANRRDQVTVGKETLPVSVAKQPSSYNAATSVPTKFTDERMGGCIFTIDGITIGVEVCLDHAASRGSAKSGRLEHAGNIQLQLIPSAGMTIGSLRTIAGGVVFNVDGLTPHVEAIGGNSAKVQSTKYDGWTFTPLNPKDIKSIGTKLEELNNLNNNGKGTWNKGTAAASANAANGSIVLYGPFDIPRI